jgi:predicted nucleic acid-binding Zn ribbon protein
MPSAALHFLAAQWRDEAKNRPLNVIASEAKQSRSKEERLDCIVARAPRND